LQDALVEQPTVDDEIAEDTAAAAATQASAQDTPASGEVVVPRVSDAAPVAQRTPQIDLGTGTFINQRPLSSTPATVTDNGDIVLSFANAGVRDVARVIMSEVLDLNYTIDPQVDGTITLQTSRPLPRSAVLPAFENVLQLIGAAVVRVDNLYKIVPAQEATRQTQSIRIGADRLPRGSEFAIQIVPLEFVAAREMQRILEPVVSQGSIVQVDPTRNLLMLAGPSREMQTWLSLIDTFDVDWLQGMSFALFPLDFANAQSVVGDLETIVGTAENAPLDGVLRFVPLERLNAVLVISPQPAYIARAEKWIQQLDESTDQAGRRLFVYYIQNGSAADLAQVLGEIFQARSIRERADRPAVAPTLRPVVVRSPDSGAPGGASGDNGSQQPRPAATTVAASAADASTSLVFEGEQEVRIIADEANNALVVLATPSDFRMVEAALGKLDIPPLQVLIEATIAEIGLTDALRYGVQWFFKSGSNSFTLSEFADGGVSSVFPGFSYVLSAGDIRAVLNALDEVTDVNVVSSPQLMVLDNRTARLQVGDQVPIVTQQAQSVSDEGTPLVNTVEQRDTGVILSVTPRVNAGGLVIMDIEQEVSDVIETTTSGIDSPTIQTRKITSSIAVQSGETVALGGLIRDRNVKTKVGVPILHRIPILGALFGSTEETVTRAELLVLLTPRVAGTQAEARAITEELRDRLRNLDPLIERVTQGRPGPEPTRLFPNRQSSAAPPQNIDQQPNLGEPPLVAAAAAPPEKVPVPSSPPPVSSRELAANTPAPPRPPSVAEIQPAIADSAAWRVQLIAVKSQENAEAVWAKMRQTNQDLLEDLSLHVQQAELSKGTFYRVQAGPLADRTTAAGLCNSLKSRNQDCLIVAP
jgi:general secretion pathway protein D